MSNPVQTEIFQTLEVTRMKALKDPTPWYLKNIVAIYAISNKCTIPGVLQHVPVVFLFSKNYELKFFYDFVHNRHQIQQNMPNFGVNLIYEFISIYLLYIQHLNSALFTNYCALI